MSGAFAVSRVAVIVVLLAVSMGTRCQDGHSDEIFVFAASSLTDVIETLADSFAVADGRTVRLNLAASSILARQIQQGARADIFLSANEDWVRYLLGHGVAGTSDRLPITSRLVLLYTSGAEASSGRFEIRNVRRLAIADPAHVPAGLYAKEWLDCADLWVELEDRIVPTLDVRAALVAVTTGAADAAVVYASDVVGLKENGQLAVEELDPACQPDIVFSVLLPPGGAGQRFYDYVSAPERSGTWKSYGFQVQ